MATFYSPKSVSDGLVLCLDAANRKSYVGSGATWVDLSGVIGNVNINNRSNDWSFATDTATGLSCLFNSSNRITSPGIDIPMNNGFNKLEGTIEMWLKPTGDYTGGQGWFNNSDGNIYTNASNWFWIGTWDTSNVLYFRQGNVSTCCNDVTVSSFSSTHYPLNVWNHWAVTWNVAAGISSIYKNGVLLSQRTNMPTNISSSNPTNTGQLFNGHARGDNMQFKGYCNIYKIYNKALTNSEIILNVNATKSRFGL
jgi:hypothetical protein